MVDKMYKQHLMCCLTIFTQYI